MSATDYTTWPKEALIARLVALEARHGSAPVPSSSLADPSSSTHRPSHPHPQPPLQTGPDLARLARRKIALRISYAGEEYAGLAFQDTTLTRTPTVEGTLFSALVRARLVDGDKGPEGCGWERSGRTDRGVSGAGNVVSLWVRSALGVREGASEVGWEKGEEEEEAVKETDGVSADEAEDSDDSGGLDGLEAFANLGLLDDAASHSTPPPPSARRELRYTHILNQLLPASIRVLAWAPVAPDFSARFSTRARHYKYFFALGTPGSGTSSSSGGGGTSTLDVRRMHAAAQRLVGEHDFRNLCRVDGSKQLTSFVRRVHRADVSIYPPPSSDGDVPASSGARDDVGEVRAGLGVLDLVGSAFLYNQVRHIMAVLFLVGAGLEDPSVVSALLNVDGTRTRTREGHDDGEGEEDLPIVDRKPEYQMADPLPLVLWDCQYDPADVSWRTDDDGDADASSAGAAHVSVVGELAAALHRSRVRAALDAHFLSAARAFRAPPSSPTTTTTLVTLPTSTSKPAQARPGGPALVPLGGGQFRRVRRYVPLLERKRLDAVEDVNRRWREGKGARREARRAVEEAGADG